MSTGPFKASAGYCETIEALAGPGVSLVLEFRDSGRVIVADVVWEPNARGRFRLRPWGCAAELADLADVARAALVGPHSAFDRLEAFRRQRARGRLDTAEPWPRPPRPEPEQPLAGGSLLEAVNRAAERIGVPAAKHRSKRNQQRSP